MKNLSLLSVKNVFKTGVSKEDEDLEGIWDLLQGLRQVGNLMIRSMAQKRSGVDQKAKGFGAGK